MTTISEQIRKEFLDECHDDYVGLWKLVWRFENSLRRSNTDLIRDLTLRLLEELLNEQLVKAGMPNRKGEFQAWRESPDEVIIRIKSEWDKLGRPPKIGDIVWFTTTKKGDAQLRKQKR